MKEMKIRLAQQQDQITKLKIQLKSAASFQKKAASTTSKPTPTVLNDATSDLALLQGKLTT